MANYTLTNKAVTDLSEIWNYTIETWSEKQADKYYFMILDTCQDLADGKAKGKNYPEINFEILGFKTGQHIIFLNSKGRVVLNVSKSDSYPKCQIDSNVLKIDKSSLFENKIDSILTGLQTFYHRKLSLVGIGFRAWCYFDQAKNCQVLAIKVGLSRDVLIFVPADIIILCLKPTLIFIKGFDKESVSLIACQIRSIKVPDSYKGKGIRYENELVRIKPGKQK